MTDAADIVSATMKQIDSKEQENEEEGSSEHGSHSVHFSMFTLAEMLVNMYLKIAWIILAFYFFVSFSLH